MRESLKYKICIVSVTLLLFGNLIPGFGGVLGSEPDPVTLRELPGDFFDQYNNDPDFDYEPSLKEGNALFWSNLWEYIKSLFEDLSKLVVALPFIFRVIMIGLLVFLIYIVITRTRLYRVFYTQDEFNSPSFEVIDDVNRIADFDAAIGQEIQNRQFRKAIRLQYLKIIDRLDKSGIISYSKEKTNYDYVKELKEKNQKELFGSLTKSYNAIWYGKIDLDERDYKLLSVDFDNFNLTMNAKDK